MSSLCSVVRKQFTLFHQKVVAMAQLHIFGEMHGLFTPPPFFLKVAVKRLECALSLHRRWFSYFSRFF